MSVWIMTERGWRPIPKVCCNSNDLQGVFDPCSIEAARVETGERADAFCKLVQEGDIIAIKSFNPRMYGAYGEKL